MKRNIKLIARLYYVIFFASYIKQNQLTGNRKLYKEIVFY